jgi:hypothetical protein
VTTAEGGKVTDVDRQQRLRAAIERAAAPVNRPGQ